jgi:hypothetical protein
MKNLVFFLLIASAFITQKSYSQSNIKKTKYFFSSGIGPVYSFFQTETPPFFLVDPNEFTVKKTFGTSIDLEIGREFKKDYSLILKYSDHKFSRKLNLMDTLTNTNYAYVYEGKLYRHQYYFQLLLSKILIKSKKETFGAGTGILFVNDGQQFFAAYAGSPNLFYPTVSVHEYRNWEFGVPFNLFIERKLNENISFGLKSQAFILISVGSFESVSLTPYIKAQF